MNFDMLGRLPPRTVGRVRELEQLCADYDGTDRNLVVGEVVSCYPDIPRYYLAWEGKKLVGALTARAARADTRNGVSMCPPGVSTQADHAPSSRLCDEYSELEGLPPHPVCL